MKLNLSELNGNEAINGTVAVISATIKKASNGDYVEMVVTDGETKMLAKRWQSSELPMTPVIKVIGSVDVFKGTKSINVKRMSATAEDVGEYEIAGPLSPTDLKTRLQDKIEEVKNSDLYSFLVHIFNKYNEEFLSVPAAVGVHHDYRGGLAQHSLEVAEMALGMAEGLQEMSGIPLDMNLIVTGALLHDIGKVQGYRMEGLTPNMTDAGKFVDHIVLGNILLAQNLQECSYVPEETYMRLQHCIAAHHGNLEWGSPVKPNCIEAMIIHYADDCSAKSALFDKERKANTGKSWTENKNFFFGSRLYFGESNE